jgi:uncharacterized membrane protein
MNFFNNLMDVYESISNVGEKITNMFKNIDSIIEHKIRKFKRVMAKMLIEFTFLALAFIFILAGITLFFSRFFSLDFVLVVMGIILLLIAIVIKKGG